MEKEYASIIRGLGPSAEAAIDRSVFQEDQWKI